MNNKIKKFLLLFKKKFLFTKVEKKKIIIFDCQCNHLLDNLFIGYDYFLLSTRFNEIKLIYLNFELFKFIFCNFFKRSLKQNYLLSLIKQINAKVVVTMIDNSYDFSIAAKYFENKIPFLAIQGANRGDIKHENSEEVKKYFLDTFFCFGEYEKKLYEKKSIKVKNFIFTGPLKAGLAQNYIKAEKINIIENEYDICLPTELSTNHPFNDYCNYTESCKILSEYVHKLSNKHGLKLIFSGEGFENTKKRKDEINFYKDRLKSYKYEIVPKLHKYDCYTNILKSNMTIGLNTTLLREAFYLKKKVFACNLTQHENADFPIRNIASPRIKNFNEFEIHTLKLLEMRTEQYFEILKDQVDKVVKFGVKPDKIILDNISKIIK